MIASLSQRARAILERSIVWDNHTCMPLDPHDERFLPQLERLRESGVTVAGVNVGFGEQSIEPHVRMLAHFRAWIRERADAYVLISNVDDVVRAKETGRLGIFFDIEGANAVADQASLIPLYYDLGVRWMLMAYNRNNRVGGGCLDDDAGLSEFGKAVIDEMNRTGMVPCVSHTGKRTAMDVLAYSKTPVIFSHSNPRALWDHPRNIDDDVILACARKGGVVGINGVGMFLGDNDTRSATIARNVDYVAKLAGVDHVGIGLDYVFDRSELDQYMRENPEVFGDDAPRVLAHGCDFVAPEQWPEIVEELLRLDYSETDIEKIAGLNFLRVARAVWK